MKSSGGWGGGCGPVFIKVVGVRGKLLIQSVGWPSWALRGPFVLHSWDFVCIFPAFHHGNRFGRPSYYSPVSACGPETPRIPLPASRRNPFLRCSRGVPQERATLRGAPGHLVHCTSSQTDPKKINAPVTEKDPIALPQTYGHVPGAAQTCKCPPMSFLLPPNFSLFSAKTVPRNNFLLISYHCKISSYSWRNNGT